MRLSTGRILRLAEALRDGVFTLRSSPERVRRRLDRRGIRPRSLVLSEKKRQGDDVADVLVPAPATVHRLKSIGRSGLPLPISGSTLYNDPSPVGTLR